MNIAIFSPNKNPYSETFIQAHKNYLKGDVFYYYGIAQGIRLENHDDLMSYNRRLMLNVYSKLTKKSSTYQWEQIVLHSLKENSIQVVLVEYGVHAHLLRNVLKASRLPIVVHFHGYDASVKHIVISCNNYKEVFNFSNKIIAVSRKMEQMLLDLGCPPEKLVYNVYGPQPEFEKVTPLFSKKQFLAVGRLTDKKAPYYIILAFKEVLKKHPDAQLLVAGDGVLFNSCLNLINYFDLEKSIKFLGVISPEEYRGLLIESRAFVQHSITAADGDMEGTPLAILEASCAGLPVVSTLHAGIPDVIVHEETGFLSEEHDTETMTNYMIRLLDDPNLAKKMGAIGKENIIKNFSLKRHIDQLQYVLEEATNLD